MKKPLSWIYDIANAKNVGYIILWKVVTLFSKHYSDSTFPSQNFKVQKMNNVINMIFFVPMLQYINFSPVVCLFLCLEFSQHSVRFNFTCSINTDTLVSIFRLHFPITWLLLQKTLWYRWNYCVCIVFFSFYFKLQHYNQEKILNKSS